MKKSYLRKRILNRTDWNWITSYWKRLDLFNFIYIC